MKLIWIFTAGGNVYTYTMFFYTETRFDMIKRLRVWLRKYRLHFLLWIVYIFYESVVVALAFGGTGAALTYIIHYLLIIVLFYVNALVALPWALAVRTTAVWRLPAVIVLELCIYLLLSFCSDVFLVAIHTMVLSDLVRFNRDFCLRNGYRCLYFIGFSSGYYYLLTYNLERKKSDELERQRLSEIIFRQQVEQELTKAQNAFLKAQINPHFLFNTLDFIYHNVVNLSPVAGEAIIMLTEMMRFAIDADKMGDNISLGDELEQVENLKSLHFLRRNEETAFSIVYGDEITELRFIPLVLLTLTENIFKHGDLAPGHPSSLRLGISDDRLVIEAENACGRSEPTNRSGKGLANIRERLRFAYGEGADFRYGADANGQFIVFLSVPVSLLRKSVSLLSI